MKPLDRISSFAASLAVLGCLAAPAQAVPVAPAYITGDFLLQPVNSSAKVKPTNSIPNANWSLTTTANWTGVTWVPASGQANFTPDAGGANGVGVLPTFSISNPVTLSSLNFSTPGAFLLGTASGGAYNGYQLSFDYTAVSNKNKAGNFASFTLAGTLKFDLDGVYQQTDDFAPTLYKIDFSCTNCNANNTTGATSWTMSGYSVQPMPLPASLALLGVGLIGAAGATRRARREQ